MKQANNLVPSASQTSTNEQNRDLSNIAFMSKGELRRTIELMYFEECKLKNEASRLMSQRILDLETIVQGNKKILEQQRKIIELQSKLNPETSPLKLAV